MYPDVGIRSDYNPLIRKLKFRGKRITNKNKKKTYDISSLNDTRKHEMPKDGLDKNIRLDNNNNEGANIDQQQIIKHNIRNVERVLG